MVIRQLEYLVALAHEKHFAHAAERCEIAQPTLSLALRQLEEELGVSIVERGNRFRGFTPEGEVVLMWARRILEDAASLRQSLSLARGSLAGRLRLGIVPSAIAAVAPLVTKFARAHPQVVIDESEMTSIEILRGLAEFEIDAGVSYVENEPLRGAVAQGMYAERYVLVTPKSGPLGNRTTVAWREIEGLSLCLLRRDMQNRRIIDAILTKLGVTAHVAIEASSMHGQFSYLETGEWSSILPERSVRSLAPSSLITRATLVEPVVTNVIGLLVPHREPLPALVSAFRTYVSLYEALSADESPDSSSIRFKSSGADSAELAP
ncbi:MAG: LysR family transcriptional regulator [Vulcanimicrobiaceae bacterium]